MSTYRLFPTTDGPSTATNFTNPFICGTSFHVTEDGCWLEGYWWWVCASGGQPTGAQVFCLWEGMPGAPINPGAKLVASSTVTSGTLSAGWNYIPLSTPINLSKDCMYQAQTGFVGSFPLTDGEFASGGAYAGGITNGPLNAYSDSTGTDPSPAGSSYGQSSFASPGSDDPTANFASSADGGFNCWIDIQISDSAPANAAYRLWPGTMYANTSQTYAANDQTNQYLLATEFELSEACTLNKLWWLSPINAALLPSRCAIWSVSSQTVVAGTDNSSPAWKTPDGATAAAADGFVYCDYSGNGITLPAGKYLAAVFSPGGSAWLGVLTNYWSGSGFGASGITNGPLSAPNESSADSPGQSAYDTAWQYPTQYGNNSENYYVDVEVTPAAAPSAQPAAILVTA